MEERLRRTLDEIGGLTVPIDAIGTNQDLFAAGLTSLATVSLLIAIEEEFDVEVPGTMLKRTTFRSIAALLAMIDQLRLGHAA